MSTKLFFLQKLSNALAGAVIVDFNERIMCVSSDILAMLEFSLNDIYKKDLSFMLAHQVQPRRGGYLARCPCQGEIELRTSSNGHLMFEFECIPFTLSRRSMRLMLLTLTGNRNSTEKNWDTDFDDFMYRVSHELRGPVATVLGLIQLLPGMSTDENEKIIGLLDKHARLLDQRLSWLARIANFSARRGHEPTLISTNLLEEHICDILTEEQNRIVELRVLGSLNSAENMVSTELVELAGNMVSMFADLQEEGCSNVIKVDVKLELTKISLSVCSDSILNGHGVAAALRGKFAFTAVANNPRSIKLYILSKMLAHLKGQIVTSFQTCGHLRVTCIVPTEKLYGTN